jgi:hypothetical protein
MFWFLVGVMCASQLVEIEYVDLLRASKFRLRFDGLHPASEGTPLSALKVQAAKLLQDCSSQAAVSPAIYCKYLKGDRKLSIKLWRKFAHLWLS